MIYVTTIKISLDNLKSIAAFLGLLAGMVLSIGIINTKFIAPFLAKPITKALKKELGELIEATVLSPDIMNQFSEQVEEVVTRETAVIVREVADVRGSVKKLESRVIAIEGRQQQHMKMLNRSSKERTRSTDSAQEDV